MKAVPIEELIDSRKYVIKKNPWVTMGFGMRVAPHSEAVLAKTPKWCKGRQGLSARPSAVAGANKVFAYCADKLDGIHPKIRADVIGEYMEYIGEKVEAGQDITDALLNEALLTALRRICKFYGAGEPTSIDDGVARLKNISERLKSARAVKRSKRRSMHTGAKYSKFIGIAIVPGGAGV